MSAEIFIFSPRDEYLATLTEENGLVSAILKDKLNNVSSEPLTLEFESDSEVAVHIKHEHRVVVRDRESKFREYVIIEEDDLNDDEGPISEVVCIPSFMYELSKKVIEDRRFIDKGPEVAWQAALNDTRFEGEVIGSFGKATTNFYYLTSVEALWKTRDVWGGDIESLVELSDNNTHIARRVMNLRLRLGADRGARFEVGHNIKEIQRTVLSEPVTALYGRGASLEILDEDGNPTGGHTRYIDFADVEWKKSNGDPVDKPKGQKWVGDPEALVKYGLEKDGQLLHLEGIYSNQNIEDKRELLEYTWDHLQNSQTPEVNYRLSVELIDRPVELGDTAVAIDREFTRPIEIQSRVIGIEYDLMDIEETTEVEMGQNLTLRNAEDEFREELENIKESLNKPRPTKPIDENSFPDIKPATPSNVEAEGLFDAIMVSWEYDYSVYISHYEVYGSQVKDFVPDSQHLLWRGDVSSFIHDVEGDQQWYYRVRAVNTRGTASDWSPQVTASSRRIMSSDILFGEIKAEHLAENLELADKLSQGTVDWINEAPLQSAQDALDKALEGLYTAQDALGEASQSFTLAQEAFDQAQENYTLIEGMALRISGRNMITHDPNEWYYGMQEYGYYYSAKQIDFNHLPKIEPGTTYTIKNYSNEEVVITLFLYENSSTRRTLAVPDGEAYTFTTLANETRWVVLVMYQGEDFKKKLGTDIRVKLERGEVATDWTIHDIDPYRQYTTITGTVEGLQTEVGDLEGNLTTVTQLAQGLETQVSNNTGDIANVMLLADGLQSTLSDVEGNVSNLLQTSTQFESRLSSVENWEIGGRNLIPNSNYFGRDIWTNYLGSEIITTELPNGYTRVKATANESTRIAIMYMLSFLKNEYSGDVLTVSFDIVNNGEPIRMVHNWLGGPANIIPEGFEGRYIFTGELSATAAGQLRFDTMDNGGTVDFNIRNLQVEKGNKATDWSPAPEDMATHTQVSLISQEVNNIQLSVVDIQDELEDAQGTISLIDQKADNISLSISTLEGDLADWGVGGRNLFAYSLLEDFGFFWLTNSEAAAPLPEGTTHITYSRSGDNPFSSSGKFSVSFLPSKGEQSIKNEIFSGSTTSKTVTVPSNARYLTFGVIQDAVPLQDIKKAKIQVEAGKKRSPYSLAYEDSIEVTNSLAYINLSEDGIRLHGSKVQISGQTQIEDAVIGSAAIADAAIKRAHLQNAIIDTAHIDDLAVTSAKIGNLAVTTAKIGTAAVTNAKIASLSVDKLTGSIATFIREGFNGITSQVEITGTGLETYSGGQRTSLLNGRGHTFYRDGKTIGTIGTNSWKGAPSYRGLSFDLEHNANFMAWGFRKDSGDLHYTTMMAWHKTNEQSRKGFTFGDNVHIANGYSVYLNDIRINGYDSGNNRQVTFSPFNWNGYDGIMMRRATDGAKLFLGKSRAALINKGNAYIEVGQDSTDNFVKSIDIYNRTYTSTTQMVRVTINGILGRSTSSRRYKLQEESVSLGFAKKILQVQAKSWYDKQACEDYSHYLSTGEGESLEPITRIGGVIAEDVHDAGLGMYVNYDEYGRPDGISANLWTLLIPVLKDHIETTDDNFDQLALKYGILKQRATHLEQRVTHLEKLLGVLG